MTSMPNTLVKGHFVRKSLSGYTHTQPINCTRTTTVVIYKHVRLQQ